VHCRGRVQEELDPTPTAETTMVSLLVYGNPVNASQLASIQSKSTAIETSHEDMIVSPVLCGIHAEMTHIIASKFDILLLPIFCDVWTWLTWRAYFLRTRMPNALPAYYSMMLNWITMGSVLQLVHRTEPSKYSISPRRQPPQEDLVSGLRKLQFRSRIMLQVRNQIIGSLSRLMHLSTYFDWPYWSRLASGMGSP
jgi:hypothetical protein